jgi:TolB-like protein
LPFEDLSGDERWARLGRGFAAEISSELARNRWLDVIAPASTEMVAGPNPKVPPNGWILVS